MRIKGDYLIYSYDFDLIYGENVSFDFGEKKVSSLYIRIDMDQRVFYAYGNVMISEEDKKQKGDEFYFDPVNKTGKLLRYGDEVNEVGIGDKAPEYTDQQDPAIQVPSKEKIKDSFIYFTGRKMEIKDNFDVIGYDVTFYMGGMRSFSLRKHNLSQGAKLTFSGFTLDRFWFSKSEGLVGNASYQYEKHDKFSSQTRLKYEEHTLIKNYEGLERQFFLMSSSRLKVSDSLNLNLTGNYNSSNLWNTNFYVNKKWSDKAQTQLKFTYNKPIDLKGEAWFGASTSFNAGKWGSFAFSGEYELQNQTLARFSYAKSLIEKIHFSLDSSYSQIKVGETRDYSKLLTGGIDVSYNAKLFNLSTAYNLNYDLVGDQVLSQPQLRLGVNPFELYGGILEASFYNVFLYNNLKKGELSEDNYSNNAVFHLSTKPIYIRDYFSLNASASVEQFLEKEGRNFTSGGFIFRTNTYFGGGVSLEGFYSIQSRRRTQAWLISGTTSQDLSALFRVNPSDWINGWISASYDPKKNRFRQSFLDISLGFFKKWEIHSLVNYDFLLNKLNNIDLYLIREVGGFQLRFIYRSLSKQFQVELVPR